MMEFTERELTLLSDGVITMIQNAGQAKSLVIDSESQKAIDYYIEELQRLNTKLCKAQ